MLSSQKLKVLSVLNQKPTRFTDLMSGLRISKKRVAVHLNELEEMNLIKKNRETGLYEITAQGKGAMADQVVQAIKPERAIRNLSGTNTRLGSPSNSILWLAYVFFLIASKSSAGYANLKEEREEAEAGLQDVQRALDRQVPGWKKELVERKMNMEEKLDEIPSGPPYGLVVASMSVAFETPLKLLGKDLNLPEGKSKESLGKGRELAKRIYDKLMAKEMKTFLTGKQD